MVEKQGQITKVTLNICRTISIRPQAEKILV